MSQGKAAYPTQTRRTANAAPEAALHRTRGAEAVAPFPLFTDGKSWWVGLDRDTFSASCASMQWGKGADAKVGHGVDGAL